MHAAFAARSRPSLLSSLSPSPSPSSVRHGLTRLGSAPLCASAVLLLVAGSARAQWPGPYRAFTIQRLGLFTPAHTGPGGHQESYAVLHLSRGHVLGSATRFANGNPFGSDAWCWDGATTQAIGLTGGSYTDPNGFQYAQSTLMGTAGHVAGWSRRLIQPAGYAGQDSWLWNGTATLPIGLVGGVYLGSAGYQFNEPTHVNATGLVAGYSRRIDNVVHENGQDCWLWNGSATLQLGYSGTGYIMANGYQYSRIVALDDAGRALGFSDRFVNAYDSNGRDAWIWQGGATTRIGLDGPPYVGTNGFRYNGCGLMNRSGKAAGTAQRLSGTTTLGSDSWFWNGYQAVQIGLWGANYTCPSGLQISEPRHLNDAGQVAGYSVRYTGVSTLNGQDTWLWTSATGNRQIGLTGGIYIGSAGYQTSELLGQNDAGQVVGRSARIGGASSSLGVDSWFWNGTSTVQVGLVGGDYLSSANVQVSDVFAFAALAGKSLTESGKTAGLSTRFLGTATNGHSAWVWNGNTTVRVGLWGGIHRGSNGYEVSSIDRLDERGNAAGASWRVAGVNTTIGKDAYYYDAAANVTRRVLASVPHSVRTSDNYAFSEGTVLTADGYLLGRYTRFLGGVDPGEERAFAFRPDVGFTDLGDLVAGGLPAAGWDSLRSVNGFNWMAEIVGHGFAAGQTAGNSVFVMRPPAGGAARNVVYGSGCGGLGLGAAPEPLLGSTLRYTVSGIPAGAAISVLLLGLTGVDPGVELSSIGAPGCYRLLDLGGAATVVLGWWAPTYDMALPWSAAMIGLPLHGQAASLVPGANPLGAITSNGVRSVVGWY
ncbi:MAG: hypothetical protein FJ265_08640 [Planctomycetes bacterium]|nr:hypothetical protein [Planctomycetota bacterium]